MFDNINNKEQQILEQHRNTTDCPINTFYRAMDNIILVKINTSNDFIFIFKDADKFGVRRGKSPMKLNNLKPTQDHEVRQMINSVRKDVAGDWYQLLLLDTAEYILNESRPPLSKEDEAWLTR